MKGIYHGNDQSLSFYYGPGHTILCEVGKEDNFNVLSFLIKCAEVKVKALSWKEALSNFYVSLWKLGNFTANNHLHSWSSYLGQWWRNVCWCLFRYVLEFNQLDWIGSTSVKFFHYFTLGIIRQNHISSVLSSIQTNDCKIQKNTKYYCCLIQLQDGIWYKNRKTYKEVRRMLKMAENEKEGTKEVRKKDWTIVFPA